MKGCGALLEGCITDLSSICGSSGNSELHGLAEEVILVEFEKKLLIKFHLNIIYFSHVCEVKRRRERERGEKEERGNVQKRETRRSSSSSSVGERGSGRARDNTP